jgi:hypothetical protein
MSSQFGIQNNRVAGGKGWLFGRISFNQHPELLKLCEVFEPNESLI